MQEILNIIHKTIYQFFDVCEDDEEVPMSDKDKLLLKVNKAICNNLKALEQEHRWIPVSERLPNKNGRYLVTVKQGYIAFGVWVDVAENWSQVTAWMPLPELYKAESEEWMDWRNEPITEKQKQCIVEMMEFSDYPLPAFIGATKGEASDFIKKYGKLAHENVNSKTFGY